MIYLLIDTSYLIFYRYYALIQWWKLAKQDDELGNPNENPVFIEKFEKVFIESVSNIKKRLKISKETVCSIACRDCPRIDIWRNEYFKEYKEHRVQDDTFMGGPFFKKVYNEKLLEKSGIDFILYHNKLEGDDVIAIVKNYIKINSINDNKFYIITNDQDYLQLIDDNTEIFNLQFKAINTSKKSFKDPRKDLLSKIILGDKSDNIPSIFDRCGIKTVEKYLDDNELLESDIDKYNVREKYLLNKKIIDFNEIPNYLQECFINNNLELLTDIINFE